MTVIAGTPPMIAGASARELAVMREAAARLGMPGLEGAALFDGLTVPFTPPASGTRAEYAKRDGMHWCI